MIEELLDDEQDTPRAEEIHDRRRGAAHEIGDNAEGDGCQTSRAAADGEKMEQIHTADVRQQIGDPAKERDHLEHSGGHARRQ